MPTTLMLLPCMLLLLLTAAAVAVGGTRLPLEVFEITPTTSTADKHKSLQYTVVYDAKDISGAAAATGVASSTVKPATEQLTVVSISSTAAAEKDLAESRRHARQMLQKQQQHRSIIGGKHGDRDVRILYQVGDSEEDLPVCAPNAVCSKIDLYETPWIERQCRCPESNRMPNNVIIHHHSHSSGSVDSLKYRNYYEREKMMQHKRMLLGEFQDKKFESLHMKKLMQKLGAVYEDDLDHLDQSPDYNDALPYAEVQDNEFPRGSAHMRHSGHRGSKEPATTFIGGCPSSLGVEDGHTIADKTRHYKMCQPVHKLPVCKHFRDYTWTLTTAAELNVTEQIVHCRCPRNSVTYLTKREPIGNDSPGYRYLFACSPLTRLRCQRKQPCKLFTVRKRQEFLDEVNINSLCQCPKGHRCPSHHTQSGVIAGESFLEDNIQTYSGYCMAND
nr:giant lens protein precursor - fruit fly (Drosophila sp.) [Drosophila sp. (in: flies)]AAA28379.1 argos [Drosophila melanogaster]AAB25390.1 eye imaginal disc neuronal differentiation regulator [Drosophila sp. (in: flies)]CAA46279.1 giant lens protein [Drosophila melanogaster]